ncbi:STAS/SEC14 domain-containing protein [Thiolapillus sp.]
MIQFIPVSEDHIFAIKASGLLTDEDYRQFLPELKTLIDKYGPISLLIELEDFRGWEAKAAWEDFKFGKEHDKDFVRIAIVGQKNRHKWLANIGDALTRTEIRFFDQDNLQDAWDWLREGHREKKESAEETQDAALPAESRPYSHILAAVDFSTHSDAVLVRALEMARYYGARLSLIHAVENIFFPSLDFDPLMVDATEFMEIDQQIFDNAVSRLEKLATDLDYPDVQHEVLWGAPKSTVLSYAEAQNVDLIVTGSHGKHGIARLLGSTSNGIAHGAGCDVLIVKPKS